MSYTDPTTLRAKLNLVLEADAAYHNAAPIMDDATYDAHRDQLVRMVAAADPSDAATIEVAGYLTTVGAPVASSKWVKTRHKAPMTSLNKAQVEEELIAWGTPLGDGGFVLSEKCDGISCSLVYLDGQLTQAITRGDGDVGEDITRNVLQMKGVIPFIKGLTGCLRGEIVLRRSDWKAHFPTYSNPRNAAAGIAKGEDGAGVEHLTVLHYQLLRDGKTLPSKVVEFQTLAAIGCSVPNWHGPITLAEVKSIYADYVVSRRDALDYDIDGLVVELCDLVRMDDLGLLNKRPRGAIAYKFPAEKKPTTLRDIRWQVGKSGRVTPVAEFDAVHLAGANVSNASLHNLSNIAKLCRAANTHVLRVGDTVLATRLNDVIPGISALIASNGGKILDAPDACPACQHPLVMNGEYLVCYGEDCSAQVLGGISRWVKKIGVLGLGDSVIEALIEGAGVTDAADLYVLDPVACESIVTGSGSRLGRTAHIVLAELRSKSEVPLHTFVGSLGIPDTGRSICKSIVDAGFDTLDKMEAATVTQIASIPGMGTTKAQKFVDGFRARRTLMDKLLDNGVTIKAKSVGAMTGKSVCFTGVRSPELEKAIEDAGGTIKGSVGSGLTYLVQKDAASQSGKTQKAVALGVKIVDLDGMWALLGRAPGTAPVQITSARTLNKATPVSVPKKADTSSSILALFGKEE